MMGKNHGMRGHDPSMVYGPDFYIMANGRIEELTGKQPLQFVVNSAVVAVIVASVSAVFYVAGGFGEINIVKQGLMQNKEIMLRIESGVQHQLADMNARHLTHGSRDAHEGADDRLDRIEIEYDVLKVNATLRFNELNRKIDTVVRDVSDIKIQLRTGNGEKP